MSNLPRPPAAYDKEDQDRLRKTLDQRDGENRKKRQDVEVAGSERLILTDTVTSDRYNITIASGVVVPVLLP